MWQNIHLVLLTLLTHFTWGHLSSRALLEHIIIQLYMLYLLTVLTSISCFKLQSSMSTQRTQPQSCLYNYLNSAPLLQLLWWTLCVPAAAVVSFSNSSGGLWPMSHLPPYSYSHRLCCFFFRLETFLAGSAHSKRVVYNTLLSSSPREDATVQDAKLLSGTYSTGIYWSNVIGWKYLHRD